MSASGNTEVRRCSACDMVIEETESICPYCGTPQGAGGFDPSGNRISVVYGPPPWARARCPSCGHQWILDVSGGDPSECCPKCGKPFRKQAEEERFCRNCGKALRSGDRYCSGCGAPCEEGAFRPEENEPVCIYGPPPIERSEQKPKRTQKRIRKRQSGRGPGKD